MAQHNATSIIEAVRELLVGIDQDQLQSDDGWWENSVGADFGRRKLRELEELLAVVSGDALDDESGVTEVVS